MIFFSELNESLLLESTNLLQISVNTFSLCVSASSVFFLALKKEQLEHT